MRLVPFTVLARHGPDQGLGAPIRCSRKNSATACW
jgi:hypothetical protein